MTGKAESIALLAELIRKMVHERGKQLRGAESESYSSDGNSTTDGDAEPGESDSSTGASPSSPSRDIDEGNIAFSD